MIRMRWLLGIIIVAIIAWAGWYLWSSTAPASLPPSGTAATTPTQQADILTGVPNDTYTDSHLSSSIEYPAVASTTSDFSSGYLPLTQTPLVAFELPQSMFAGTNLVEAGVYVGATTSPSVMTSCTDLSSVTNATATSTTTINGQDFVVIDTTGAAAGNVYQEKVFRAFQNGYCLEIVELLHSGDIGNYASGTQPFDEAQFSGILDSIMQTYQSIPTGE